MGNSVNPKVPGTPSAAGVSFSNADPTALATTFPLYSACGQPYNVTVCAQRTYSTEDVEGNQPNRR